MSGNYATLQAASVRQPTQVRIALRLVWMQTSAAVPQGAKNGHNRVILAMGDGVIWCFEQMANG
jgi:hypothetical protein